MPTPAKIPVHKTLDECRELVFSRVAAVHDEYAGYGWLPARLNLNAGVVRGILEITAWVLFSFYEFLARSLPNAFPLEASDDWLNMHAEQITLPRRPATKAEGAVTFTRAADTPSGNIRIPAGRIVRTRPDGRGMVYRYVSTAEAVLPDGEQSVAVPVLAEEYGQGANATAGQIREISTHIPGIGEVTNLEGWLTSEGANAETDAQLRERYTLAWLEKAGCTSAAYKSWALSVPGVLTAAILDQHPTGEGTVGVIVRGTAGIPTETLLERVRAAVAEKAPVNDNWWVAAPDEVPLALDIIVEVISGVLEDAADEAENRIRALFPGSGSALDDVTPFEIGEDFTRDRVVAAIVGTIPGVKRIVWTAPQADLTAVPERGLVALATLKVTAAQAEA